MVFEKIIKMLPAYDKRAEGGGVHGVDMEFVLKGEAGAVIFRLSTNWNLPHVRDEQEQELIQKARRGADIGLDLWGNRPLPAQRGYHTATLRYHGQHLSDGPCPYLTGGKHCYFDFSVLNAEPVFLALLERGLDGVWQELEHYYHNALELPITERTFESLEFGAVIRAVFGDEVLEKPKEKT